MVATDPEDIIDDETRLEYALTYFIRVSPDVYEDDLLVKALTYEGITTFRKGLVALTEEHVMDLSVQMDGGTFRRVPLNQRNLLVAFLAFYHRACRQVGDLADVGSINRAAFNEFRTREYNPIKKVIPWHLQLRYENEEQVAGWKRSIKPTQSDYKEF
jgi:hypothetical protein